MKTELSREQIEQGLRMIGMSLHRVTGTSEVIKDGDTDYCEVTLRIALDKSLVQEERIMDNC
jgi:hypothetical protein